MSDTVIAPQASSSKRKKSRKLQSNLSDSTSNAEQNEVTTTRKKKEKILKVKQSRIQLPSVDDFASEDTENEGVRDKAEKKNREKRRRSVIRKSRAHLLSQDDVEQVGSGSLKPGVDQIDSGIKNLGNKILDSTKSKFLKKPFKKPTDKTEPDVQTKESKDDNELLNLIHSYATEEDSQDEGEHGVEDVGESEPRKFEPFNPKSDSSDEYVSDAQEDETKKDTYFAKSRISYIEATPTPYAHLDKLVDRVVGGGLFSAFPSEATFQQGHRLSVYDAVEAHLLRQGKKTFLFRTVLVASHEESSRELIAWHSKTIETINSICYDELATGFFLIYPRYFVHVLEGSEETLCKFLIEHSKEFDKDKEEHESTKDDEDVRQFKTVKTTVTGFFSIRDRFLERWVYEKTKPYNRRVHKGAFRKRLFEFLKCTFIMCAAVGRLPENHPLLTVQVDRPPDEPETEEDRIKGKEVLAVEYIQRMREIAQWMPSKKTLVDIMKRKKSRKIQLKSPKDFIRDYWSLPPIILTSEVDWPIPCRIAPYD